MDSQLVALLHWLARQKGPDDLASREGEQLAELLGLERPDPRTIASVVDRGIGGMDADAYQDAARQMLGSGPQRWDAVKSRQRRAGAAFGVGADAFRRKRAAGRSSRENEVYAHLARTLISQRSHRASRPAGVPGTTAPGGQEAGVGPMAARWPSRRLVRLGRLLAGIVLAVLVVGVWQGRWMASMTGSSPRLVVGPVDGGCPHRAGATGDASISDEVIETLVTEYEIGGGGASYGCALSAVARLPQSPIVYQEYGRTGQAPATAIIAFDGGGALTMPFAAWGSYRQIGGKSGDNAHQIAGDPIELMITRLASYVVLDSEVQLVAERLEAPYFFVMAPAGEAWEERGGPEGEMGLPRSNLQVIEGTLRQEFDHGWLELDNATGLVRWRPVESPADDLPPAGPRAGRLVRQSDGTAWFVTAEPERERKWVPDGLTWECLGGWDEVVANDVPGYAVGSLNYAGIATCADSLVGPIDVAQYCAGRAGPEATGESPGGVTDWFCVDDAGRRQEADLQDACDEQYGAGRRLISRTAGDPTGWRCADPSWEPLPAGS